MSNNFGNVFIRIPADCFFNMDIVTDVEKIKTIDGSKYVELNEMVRSSDIINEEKVNGHRPHTLKLIRK